MKKWAFVSDFDGTISKQDFYKFVIENYFPDGRELYTKWKSGEMLDIKFLATVFKSIHQTEEKVIEDILSLPLDEHVPAFIETIRQAGGDFYILSAGTDYYIHHILNKYGIKNVKVFSNPGYFEENNVHLDLDPSHKHYSERYGIDKSKVIQDLKAEYDTIYFAGDSEPDSHPAEYADLTFAKDSLQSLLKERNVPFVAVDSFKEIEEYLKNSGVL